MTTKRGEKSQVCIQSCTVRTRGTQVLYEQFLFDDGQTVRVNGGLKCSQHGRYACQHNHAAHLKIVAAHTERVRAERTAYAARKHAAYERSVDEMHSHLIDPRAEDLFPF